MGETCKPPSTILTVKYGGGSIMMGVHFTAEGNAPHQKDGKLRIVHYKKK